MRRSNDTMPACLTCLPGEAPIPVYHITHLENLAGIMRDGALLPDNLCAAFGIIYQRIGQFEIKEKRRSFLVKVEPYGCIGDYVPFYVAPRSPMLYKINKGSVVGYNGGQDNIIYIVSSLNSIYNAGFAVVFTDGQANHMHTTHFNDPRLIGAKIDWAVMRAKIWKDTESDPQRKRKRQAEVLVHGRFPWELVEGIAARTDMVAARVEAVLKGAGRRAPPVVTRPGWYY